LIQLVVPVQLFSLLFVVFMNKTRLELPFIAQIVRSLIHRSFSLILLLLFTL